MCRPDVMPPAEASGAEPSLEASRDGTAFPPVMTQDGAHFYGSTREELLLHASRDLPEVLPTGDRSSHGYTSRRGGARYSDKYPRCSDSFRVSGDLAFTLEDMRNRVKARELLQREAADLHEAQRSAIVHDVPIEAIQEVQAARYAKFCADGKEIAEIHAEVDQLLASRGEGMSQSYRPPLTFSKAPQVSPGGWAIESDRGAN